MNLKNILFIIPTFLLSTSLYTTQKKYSHNYTTTQNVELFNQQAILTPLEQAKATLYTAELEKRNAYQKMERAGIHAEQAQKNLRVTYLNSRKLTLPNEKTQGLDIAAYKKATDEYLQGLHICHQKAQQRSESTAEILAKLIKKYEEKKELYQKALKIYTDLQSEQNKDMDERQVIEEQIQQEQIAWEEIKNKATREKYKTSSRTSGTTSEQISEFEIESSSHNKQLKLPSIFRNKS